MSGSEIRGEEEKKFPLNLLHTGQLLKKARIEQGLSLNDVSDALLIRRSTLDAIESARWEKLPHIVYVRGYIKLYAAYLKMSEKVELYMQIEKSESSECTNDAKQTPGAGVPKKEKTYRFAKRLLLIFSSAMAFMVMFVFYPVAQTAGSLTRLQEVSVGFFDSAHSMTDVRRLLIPYSERPWLNLFTNPGETRTMILDLPESSPMTHSKQPSEVLTNDEG
jgi:transcriptional regulator with XRE-family HTH domain